MMQGRFCKGNAHHTHGLVFLSMHASDSMYRCAMGWALPQRGSGGSLQQWPPFARGGGKLPSGQQVVP
jgi:hypothetical protein